MTSLKELHLLEKKIVDAGENSMPIPFELGQAVFKSLKTLPLDTTEDAFLYFASLNLLNAYVKQHKLKSYYFKSFIPSGIDKILQDKKLSNIKFTTQTEGMLVIVQIFDMQFSFHGIKPSPVMQENMQNGSKYYQKFDWDGVRKQPQALEIYNFAKDLENLTLATENENY